MSNGASSLDDLKKQVSIHDLDEGFAPRTPLRDVEGVMRAWNLRVDQNPNFPKPVVRAILSLDQLVIHQSLQPYTLPQADIEIATSKRAQSAWGYWSKSAGIFFPKPQTMDNIVGHRIRIALLKEVPGNPPTPCMTWDGKTNKDVQKECWLMVSCDGKGVGGVGPLASTMDEKIIAAISGKSAAIANQELLKIPELRADPVLVGKVMQSLLIPELIASGKIKDTGGVLNRV